MTPDPACASDPSCAFEAPDAPCAATRRSDAEALPPAWTRDHVALRLVDAFRALDRLPRDAGPRRAGNHWPTTRFEFADAVAQAELPEDERRARDARRNALALRPSGVEIARMDMAFEWLRDLNRADSDLAQAVSQWALCVARRRSVRKLCRARGLVPASFYLLRARGLDLLAATLTARGVAVF